MAKNPPSSPGTRLRERDITAALAKLNDAALLTHINAVGIDLADAKEILALIRRANKLVIPYPNTQLQTRRDKLLDKVEARLADLASDQLMQDFTDIRTLISCAEQGYREILVALEQAEISQLAPARRAAAALSWASVQSGRLAAELAQSLRQKGVVLAQSISLRDASGRPASADAILEGTIFNLGATLVMEAIKEGWIEDDDLITLPSFEMVTNSERELAGPVQMLALAWREWRKLEETARWLDGTITVHDLADTPLGIKQIYSLNGSFDLHNDYSAFRTSDQFAQSYTEMMHRHRAQHFVHTSRPAALPPQAFLSTGEMVALAAIDENVGFATRDDNREYGGLRLVEWLRGFAVLSDLAERWFSSLNVGGDPNLPLFETRNILVELQTAGLTGDKAEAFLNETRFRRTSRDLFDAPVVQIDDGRVLLCGPALRGQNHCTVVLSAVTNRGYVIDGKGSAFEAQVLKLFRQSGLKARSFKFRRGGAEYEYDAVVAWGDYVFLFECKNRSLPGESPQQRHYFAQEVRSHVKQVHRLIGALQAWPEVLMEQFNEDLSAKTIVGCVLNNLPYARIEPLEGVCFYDYSALSRFFSSGTLNLKSTHNVGAGRQDTQTIPTLRIWQGKKPNAQDLAHEIRGCTQLRVVAEHAFLARPQFLLSSTVAVETQIMFRRDVTPMTMADIAGIPRMNMRLKLERGRLKAAKERRRADRKTPSPVW